ncbi:MAG: TIGR03905 family TSCPD domain-containing protein [Synergistaceae bacterium]|nr:TIGR03905 family TSCPD domain-containing protein [Synergistaceae bacterium]MBQ6002108.1 TIGR03905 family TSCPD domain-containing protein [Synergistaceae bacterium]MBR0167792.1 TIGR03905 family TSCPD domain-containing protein [Synergistaceae bacterium]MBR0279953.1 TIGR03905 family TSCPD domain-containing protein [Synergistaceae bacterium]
MKEFVEFIPTGICSRKITFELEDGKMYNLKFYGGCQGNLKAIAILLEGADALRAAEMLRGNQCRDKGTSCADQLAIAIEQAMSGKMFQQKIA